MEVGAVKQDFNTEVILLKKKLNQAKIQIIRKLIRNAKQLTEKKAPEKLQEKLKRKAEFAIKEVVVIKKIKPKGLAKFIVTHKGELNTFLNKPQVDEDKACARLLLHKALQDKYKFIRGRFSKVAINDLFMSRLERRKVKKEAIEKQKNKKKAKNNKIVNTEGDWNVEDAAMGDDSKVKGGEDDDVSGDEGSGNEMSSDENDDNEVSGDENEMSSDENDDNEVSGDENDVIEVSGKESDQSEGNDEIGDDSGPDNVEEQSDAAAESSDDEVKDDVSKILKASPEVKPVVSTAKSKAEIPEVVNIKAIPPKEIQTKKPPKEFIKRNPEKKQKELTKTKHFNEKILQKKIKKDSDAPVAENKIVDSFFITSTGENYMSVVEARAPDEVKEEHIGGNRRLRRAVQHGLVHKSKLRKKNNYNNVDGFNKQNGYGRGNNFNNRFNDRQQNDRRNFIDRKPDFNDKRGFINRNDSKNDEKPEKLHPSWEAKKKKSGILPYEGKKIVFDES